MRILVACEESQAITKQFRERGLDAFSCDVKPCSGGHPEWHLQTDVLTVLNQDWDMMIAHPECTRLANSGVRWLTRPPRGKTLVKMWSELFHAVDFYNKLRYCGIPRIAIENPIMHCHAKELIKPAERQVVQPWWFGDPAFKATGFELINLPKLKPTNQLTPPKKGTEDHKKWSFIHRMPPGPKRAELRSKTFPGMAKAIAAQWDELNV